MKTAGRLFPVIRFSIFILFFFILGCAKSIAPPGGPIDRTPPEIIESIPVSGSVGISVDSSVIIEFSEAIHPVSTPKAVFITPLQEKEPKIKVKGRFLSISFAQSLEKNRTYVINLNTDLRDAHNVALDQSVNIAFSTGPTIDIGSIAGTVFEKSKGKSGISVALFSTAPEEAGLPVDSLTPEYLTQSGEGGKYKFEYLPDGKYYPVAFIDGNKNRSIEPKREMIGLPFSEVLIEPENRLLSGIDYRLHQVKEKYPTLRSVSINPDLLIKVRFNRELDKHEAETLFAQGEIRGDSIEPMATMDYYSAKPYPSSDYFIRSKPLQTGLNYTLAFDLAELFPAIPDSLKQLSYKFTAVEIEDLSRPRIERSYPANKAVNIGIDSLFRIVFSEPIDSTAVAGAFRLADSSEEWRPVTVTQENSFIYMGKATQRLRHGKWYQLEMDNRRIIDLAGNALGDSTTILTFTTVGQDTLGHLSGDVVFTDAIDAVYPVVVSFQPSPRGDPKQIILPAGQSAFIIDLLPGYYSVSAYLDRNRNNRFDFGSIIPYQLAEPFSAPADTMRVRTRFESSGVTIQF
ncbi:MAG: hypothetical protein GY841_07980 [FCB group bacterium]|nr:hypothetical protein [FCB group bacterium]